VEATEGYPPTAEGYERKAPTAADSDAHSHWLSSVMEGSLPGFCIVAEQSGTSSTFVFLHFALVGLFPFERNQSIYYRPTSPARRNLISNPHQSAQVAAEESRPQNRRPFFWFSFNLR
jgi:hypothetical protein